MAKKWIQAATQNKGGLHSALGVPQGQKIPAKKMQKALHSTDMKVKKEAQLARTLASFKKK